MQKSTLKRNGLIMLWTLLIMASGFAAAAEQGNISTRVQALEQSVDALETKWPSWLDDISFNGDLRYRHEMIDAENSKARHRNRIRGRIGITAKITQHVDVGFRLATGSDDPVSTNATLDGGFTTKDIKLDLAYIDVHPECIENFHLIGGKIKLPFYKPGKSELIWDSDLNPEGGAINYKVSAGPVDLIANLGGLWVNERSSGADSALFGGQGLVKFEVCEESKATLTLGSGAFNYTNTKGKSSFHHESTAADPEGAGNSLVGENYRYDYHIFEAFAELGANVKVGQCVLPFSVFGDYVLNTATGTNHKEAWLVGAKVGKCKKPGSWELKYNYRQVEQDSVMGAFTDSDFRGGGTDARGHEIGVGCQVWEQIKTSVSYFNNERNLADRTASNHKDDYHRLMFDVQIKF